MKVFVPLRLISEAAGATVAYSAAPHAVRITGARTIAAAGPVALASPNVAAPAAPRQGVPWWVWLLALIALAVSFAFLRRRKPDPIHYSLFAERSQHEDAATPRLVRSIL